MASTTWRSTTFGILSVLSAAALLTACTSCSGARGRPDEWSAAPDQYACTTDEDCVLAAYHFEEEPCCNASFTSVQAGDFVRWRDAWQARECGSVDCEEARASYQSTLSPQQPLPCYFEPRCNDGQCGGSCGP